MFWNVITLFCIIILLPGSISASSSGQDEILFSVYSSEDSLSKEFKFLQESFDKINRELYLLAEFAGRIGEVPSRTRTIEMARIRNQSCTFIEDLETMQSSPELVNINTEYEILKFEQRHYQLKYSEDLKLWIPEQCVDKFFAEKDLTDFDLMLSTDVNANLRLARISYQSIEQVYEQVLIFKRSKIDKLPDDSSKKLLLLSHFEKIRRKKANADSIYDYYVYAYEAEEFRQLKFYEKLSLTADLSFGSSRFRTHFSEFLRDEAKAGNTDIGIRGTYNLDASSRISFALSHRAESLQTSYKNTIAQASYIANQEKLDYSLTASYNIYKDEFRDINSYDRMNVSGRAIQDLGSKVKMFYDLGFTNYNYKVNNDFDYTRESLGIRSQIQSGNNKIFEIGAIANASQSVLSTYEFIHLKPKLKFISQKINGSSQLQVFAERYDFKNVPQRSSDKLFIGINSQKSLSSGLNKSFEMHAFARVFPEGPQNDFYQFLIGTSRNSYSTKIQQSRSQLSLRYFPNNENFSHADYSFDYGTYSRFYSAVNGNIRYWYPDETQFISTDIYLKFGLQFNNFSIGPLVGVHSNIDLNASDISFRSDKNNYRVGAEAQGNFYIENRYRLNFRAAYDYGFNYNSTVDNVSEFGEIMYGELLERHPTSIQVNADFSTPIRENLEFISSVQFYQLETDIRPELSINPIIQRDRLSFKLGLRLRYN